MAGALGTADAGTARTFPTQACLDKASALLGMMTSDEKMAQLQQIERANVTAADITTYGVGSVYSQGGSAPATNTPTGWADMIDGFRTASFSSRLKIPIIYGLDVVHGVGPVKGATVFPHNIGLGATRDPALVEQVATAVAEEAAGVGADFPFAPVVAVARDERWGRTYESFGETPELPSAMGVAYTNGFQKRGGPFTVLANAKHYLGDGGTMNGVNAGNTSGDETALRALHLTPYQAVVGAGVGSIMASYSSWQGTRMHMNTMMITDVLKGQLGFAGFVGSDYNGCTHERRDPGGLPERRRRHGHDVRAHRVVLLVDGARAGSRHGPAEPHRRRRPAHPGRQVRDGPARRHAAAGRPDIDSGGRLGRAPGGGATGGGGVGGGPEERRRRVAAVEVRRGRRARRQDRRQHRQPVRRLDRHLAGDERERDDGRDHRPGGAGGRADDRARELRAGRLRDRQWRDRRHRRHRRDAVFGRVRRHPQPRREGRRASTGRRRWRWTAPTWRSSRR